MGKGPGEGLLLGADTWEQPESSEISESQEGTSEEGRGNGQGYVAMISGGLRLQHLKSGAWVPRDWGRVMAGRAPNPNHWPRGHGKGPWPFGFAEKNLHKDKKQ